MVVRRALSLVLISAASAFTTVQKVPKLPPLAFSTATSETTDVEAIYEQLGIEPGKLALGVKPDEVLKYIGTREMLIEKAKKDIPSFDTAKATSEVDKFLMDPETLDLYIRFGKELEKNPDFKVPEPPGENEGLFSLRNIVVLYLAFVIFSNGPDLLRGYIADQEVAGTWSATGIAFIDNWVEATSAEAVAQAMVRAAKEATN